jgi:ketosteroid isomerase-like protein
MRTLVLLALAAFTALVDAAGPSPDEQQLLKLQDDWVHALETHDRALLNQIVAKDFTFIEPDGTVKSRDEYLADRSGEEADVESFTLSELKVRVFGASALVTGVAHITERRQGVRYRFSLRWKELWMKDGSRWQVLAGQATPVNAQWDKPFIVETSK